MPLFQYEAKNIKGRTLRGKIEAKDETDVAFILGKMDYFPLKIVPYSRFANIDITSFKKVTTRDIAIFCRQLSIVISSGISILNSLNIVMQQTENSRLRETIAVVIKDIETGKSFSDAVKKHKVFPDMLVNMLEVGEVSGDLDKIMMRLSGYYDREYNINQKLKQSLTYPAFVCIFATCAITFLIDNIFPKFLSMIYQFDGIVLPLSTRIILKLYNLVSMKYMFILFLLIISGAYTLRYCDSIHIKKFFDVFRFNLPLYGKLYKGILEVRFSSMLSVLTFSGIPVSKGLMVCADAIGNYTGKKIILDMVEKIAGGMSLSEALYNNKLFSGVLRDMVRIGEESGNLDVVLNKTAEFHEIELGTRVNQFISIIEPSVIIILALIIGFIILSILMPIFQLYDYML